jgi:micrococcal nuclease
MQAPVPRTVAPRAAALALLVLLISDGCSAGENECGPAHARVARVIDGDTVELADSNRLRYLLVDTPEATNGHDECYGAEAREYNRSLVEQREVDLRYDQVCRDRFGRLLAWVTVAGREVNERLISDGYGCVLHIPPNGDARAAHFRALQSEAELWQRGLWSACAASPCD